MDVRDCLKCAALKHSNLYESSTAVPFCYVSLGVCTSVHYTADIRLAFFVSLMHNVESVFVSINQIPETLTESHACMYVMTDIGLFLFIC